MSIPIWVFWLLASAIILNLIITIVLTAFNVLILLVVGRAWRQLEEEENEIH